MMNVGLIDVDGHNFPNLALMKLARYYRGLGANVEWYTPFTHYDVVYLNKVFTFSPDYDQCITNADRIERGGTGYRDYSTVLPTVIAKMLVSVKWLKYIRFACDTSAQLPHLFRACDLLKQNGYKGKVFMNVLLTEDINECLARINAIRGYKKLEMLPFAQPYLDFEGRRQPPQWQKDMARWCNMKATFFSTEFGDYTPRKSFKCKQYLL